jgi:predicted nucleic acid-binding protein
MIVVDTHVIAYVLIEGDRTGEAQMLRLADPDWRSEPFLLVEFSNLLATQVRARALSVAQASSLLESAAQLITGWLDVSCADALAAAIDSQVCAYDARFVACARQLSAPLVTEDARLRVATAGLSMSMAQALAGATE